MENFVGIWDYMLLANVSLWLVSLMHWTMLPSLLFGLPSSRLIYSCSHIPEPPLFLFSGLLCVSIRGSLLLSPPHIIPALQKCWKDRGARAPKVGYSLDVHCPSYDGEMNKKNIIDQLSLYEERGHFAFTTQAISKTKPSVTQFWITHLNHLSLIWNCTVSWWSSYGISTPTLMIAARHILGICCIASSYERNCSSK